MHGEPSQPNGYYGHGIPSDYASATKDGIPIDPTLDPELSGTGYYAGMNGSSVSGGYEAPLSSYAYLDSPTATFPTSSSRYSQGPQGDPFALPPPPPPPELVELQHEPSVSPSKSPKKKRRHKRGENCEVCHGDAIANKAGNPEPTLTCEGCGRCWHPSCLELGQSVHTDAWRCSDCKSCEVCHTEGNDDQMVLCDYCDRGWHLGCLNPPLEETPSDTWHCPRCPPIEPTELPPESPGTISVDVGDGSHLRAQSVASTSRSAPDFYLDQSLNATSPAVDDSDMDVETQEALRKAKQRKKKASKSKARARPRGETASAYSSSPVTAKTPRLRVRPPSPPPPERRVTVRLRLPGRGKQREDDEERKGMFDDILSLEHRDTSKTVVDNSDKQRFENSRRSADVRVNTPRPVDLDSADYLSAGPSSRPLRSHLLQRPFLAASLDSPVPTAPGTPGGPLDKGKSKAKPSEPAPLRIQTIRFGEFDIKTWYDAPFPEEYNNLPEGRLWICEFCLKYMKSAFMSIRHRMKCKSRHPPGDEIYRDRDISVFEIDGRKNKIYCQNLCLLSKMFLDHKSLFYDVEPFLFYVMTESNDLGARFIGYFSKEKRSPKDYNVSCIMTLPVRQRRGWGNLLIDFSYLLSKKENRSGSPEKPLSALGAISYQRYWSLSLKRYLATAPDHPSLEDIRVATSMTLEDICSTLKNMNILHIEEIPVAPPKLTPGQSIKYPKGRKHSIARRHLHRAQTVDGASPTGDDVSEKGDAPFVPPKDYEVRFDREQFMRELEVWEAKGQVKLRPEKLRWSPFLVARVPKTDGVDALPLANGPPSATEEEKGVIVIDGASIAKGGTPGSAVADSPVDVDVVGTPAQLENDELPSMTEDAALAAKLAREEEATPMVPRRLRSDSRTFDATPVRSSPRDRKRAGSAASSVRTSTSKRRRTRTESLLGAEEPEDTLPVPKLNGHLEAAVSVPNGRAKSSDETTVVADVVSANKDNTPHGIAMNVDGVNAETAAVTEDDEEDHDAEGEIDDEYT